MSMHPSFQHSDTWPSMSLSTSHQSRKGEYLSEAFESEMPTGAQESSENRLSISTVHQAEPIGIGSEDSIESVAFLVDGKHIVGGGTGEKIRCWRVEDGALMATMDAGDVRDLAVSRDGKCVVSGSLTSG